jgi:transglutaminase-like putative cysteine protease
MARRLVVGGGPMAVEVTRMRVRVGSEFRLRAATPVPTVWQVRPRLDDEPGLVDETWMATAGDGSPVGSLRSYVDRYDNRCDRLLIPGGETTVLYDALVDVPQRIDEAAPWANVQPVDQLPDEALVYLLPSRFCPVDELADEAWATFGDRPRGWDLVAGVCDWVHDHLDFAYGSSTPSTTARDVFHSGTGVCRDFAHLAVTLLRALNVPARYVFGYLPDIDVPPPDLPMDFCAWLEAYLDDRWYTFDPRNNERRTGRVVIGRGRDAVDVAMLTSYGPVELLGMTVWADVAAPGDRPLGHGPAVLAASTSEADASR